MELGKIKKMTDRGFGFIKASAGDEVFFHRNECQSLAFDTLSEGQEVAFDREATPRGARARNVRLNDV
jgi:CspA family cold shock protein